MRTPRGLGGARCLGDGEWPGLPGREGAQTICSGSDALLSTDMFSLPSKWTLSESGSSEKLDDTDSERARDGFEKPVGRCTDKSRGVVIVVLFLIEILEH